MLSFNYHHLYYFYVIAQEGSISGATKRLLLAQSTLSTELKQLEEFLGVKLFDREKRKLILTEEGHLVFSYAKMIFDLGQELTNQLTGLAHEGQNRLTIGVSTYVPKTILDTLLEFIWQREPAAFISVKEERIEHLTQELTDHMLDLIITDSPFETHISSAVQNHRIGRLPLVFCAHARIARKVTRFPDDLAQFPLILPAAPRQVYYTLREYLAEHQLEPRVIGEIEDIEVIRRLALRGRGIAPLNLLTVRDAPSRQKLVILNDTPEDMLCEKIYMITQKRKYPHPLVEIILNEFHLEDYIQDLEYCRNTLR